MMEKIRLGRTNLMVTKSGFGALPIQRVSMDEAKKILCKAYDNGFNFYDTARVYTDSEEKIGNALSGVRSDIIIASKSMSGDKDSVLRDIDTGLKNLKTDYIDIYQIHNPEKMPDPDDENGMYNALVEAKKKGKIRFISISNHRLEVAVKAANSGLYDTVQFPLNCLSSDKDLELIKICKENDVGLIAMKAISGGLISNIAAAFAFLRQFDNVVPIWGIQKESELDEFIALEKTPPVLDKKMLEIIEKERKELSGSFCRGCGYCQPCPQNIHISWAARMSLFLNRLPYRQFMTDEWKNKMLLISNCTDCGHCKEHCPYKLDTPALLRENQKYYIEFYEKHK
jgi:uncharacterized protein